MIEKVNPKHPDKIADRIAGALVDIAYKNKENPKVAIEVLIGHGLCTIIAESDYCFKADEVKEVVNRIAGEHEVRMIVVPQDPYLNENQSNGFRCGDNGIFKGVPLSHEAVELSSIARAIYKKYDSDGKYILDGDRLIICQSNANGDELRAEFKNAEVNPIGDWTGGTYVDAGATNRKLGSDMADAVTGGGLHGKDLSKADVSVNIYAFIKAQVTDEVQEFCCAIGDTEINGVPYEEIVETARDFIKKIGGFEKFAEWGLY